MTVRAEENAGHCLRDGIIRLVSVWGLPILLLTLIVAFSVLKPHTFPTYFNFLSVTGNKSIDAMVALAVFIPMAANQFHLSVGFLIGIAQVLTIGVQGQGMSWPVVACLVLVLGAGVGLAKRLLITAVGIDSFIATLGVGSLLGIPAPALYLLAIAIALWVFFEYLPAGRFLYVLGDSKRAADLNGISARRFVAIAFVAGVVLSAFAVGRAESVSARRVKRASGEARPGRNTCCQPSQVRCSRA